MTLIEYIKNAVPEISDSKRRLILTLLQYFLGLVALTWVVRQITWKQIIDLLSNISPILLILLFTVTAAAYISKFYSLHVLHNQLRPTPFAAAANVDLTVLFINHLLPSRLAGRSATPLVIRQFTDITWSGSIAIAGVHTANYALLYGIVALAGLAFAYSVVPFGLVLVILLSICLYFAVGAVIMLAGRRMNFLNEAITRFSRSTGHVPWVGSWLSSWLGKVPDYTDESESVFRRLTNSPRVWTGYSIGWAGSSVIFPAIRVWLLLGVFEAQGTVSLLLLPLFIVMSYSVTLLPLTPGGIGIAEASATLVFASLGIPENIVAPVIVIDRFLGVYLPTLIGWIPISRMDLGLSFE